MNDTVLKELKKINDFSSADKSFFETDAVLFNAEGLERVGLFSQPDEKLHSFWIESFTETEVMLRGYSYNTDDRDPDETVPFAASAKIINGSFQRNGENLFAKAQNGRLLFGIAFRFLDEPESAVENALMTPRDFKKGCENCLNTYLYNISGFEPEPEDERTAFLAAKALHGLGFNLKKAPGRLSKHISSFPSRGAYPTHFLWDTCYEKEYREASQRLLAVLKADGEMHELFDSKTGRGLGACEQGWTNAIFIRLLYETQNAAV